MSFDVEVKVGQREHNADRLGLGARGLCAVRVPHVLQMNPGRPIVYTYTSSYADRIVSTTEESIGIGRRRSSCVVAKGLRIRRIMIDRRIGVKQELNMCGEPGC
jgi:hypothetical protein